MAHFDFIETLPAPPEAVWPFLTDPALMNRWSLASVEGVSEGDGGGFGTVGARRQVRLRFGPRTERLNEVIFDADPPRRIEYRVIPNAFVRAHRGEITLSPAPEGSMLRWVVEMEFSLAPFDALATRIVLPDLRRSLGLMRDVVAGAKPPPTPASRKTSPIDETYVLPALLNEAEATLAAQRDLAAEYEQKGDPKRWFTRLYAITTECMIEAFLARAVLHRGWLLRLIPLFHAYYVDNIRRFTGELPGSPEAHWEKALRRTHAGDAASQLLQGIRMGMIAHIEEDLPRTLARVYVDHYADKCEYRRFMADYLLLGPILEEPASRMLPLLPRELLPWRFRIAEAMTPDVVRRLVRIRDGYDVPGRRLDAFGRGERIASLMLEERRRIG